MNQTFPRALMLIAWHGLAILLLSFLPMLIFKAPWWEVPLRDLASTALLLAAYGVSVLIVLLFVRTEGRRAASGALVITLSTFAVFLVALAILEWTTPRYIELAVFFAAATLIPLSVTGAGVRIVGICALGVAALALAGYSAREVKEARRRAGLPVESLVNSAFYALEMSSHHDVVPQPDTRGGGLDHLGDDVLLGDGGGRLYALNVAPGGRMEARELPTRVPNNREEFARAFGGSAQAPVRSAEYSELGPPRVQTWRFRVADILTQSDGDALRIFASHHYWKAKEECFVVRVSMIEASLGALDASLRDNAWRTLYESTPCISLTGAQRKLGKNPFKGEEIGGRMALLDGDTLLLTLGDQGFSGIESLQAFAQDPDAAYGKTIRIDVNSLDSEIFTSGHRNPQGLYVAGDGRIWLTEHGSQGGDEVNLLEDQANYGWPLVTYGTDYGAYAWPLSAHQGRHDGFTQPAYAWVPSIGVSSLAGVERERFGIWRGDLLVGSLATRSLYRLAIAGDRIVLAEALPLGKRIRDILELNDGRILLWTDETDLVTLAPAAGMSGALSFATLCSGCHVAVDGLSHRIGPDLHRIVGRSVASASGFNAYSAALTALGGQWSQARLDAYLRNPQSVAPGTSMAFAGVEDDAERAALIEHLRTLDKPPR